MERMLGSWPSRAPTKNNLDEVKMEPFTEPKQERDTKTGMIHDITPRTLSPKSTATAFEAKNSAGESRVK